MNQPLTDAEKFQLEKSLRDNLEIDEIKYIVLEIGISLGNLDVFSRDELVKKLIHFAGLRGEVNQALHLAKQLKPGVDFSSQPNKESSTVADQPAETQVQKSINDLTDTQLVTALLKCPSMADASSRNAVVEQLPVNIRSGIARNAKDKFDVMNIVKACRQFPSGLQQLVDTVNFFDEGTTAVQELNMLL